LLPEFFNQLLQDRKSDLLFEFAHGLGDEVVVVEAGAAAARKSASQARRRRAMMRRGNIDQLPGRVLGFVGM
jgi:hypothetical protein